MHENGSDKICFHKHEFTNLYQFKILKLGYNEKKIFEGNFSYTLILVLNARL